MGITRSEAQDYFAYRAYLKQLGGDNSASRSQLAKNLSMAIREELSERQWECMELYYIKQLKMEDVAAHLGIHVSTVSRTIARGRNRLKRCLRYGARELLRSSED